MCRLLSLKIISSNQISIYSLSLYDLNNGNSNASSNFDKLKFFNGAKESQHSKIVR